MHAMELGKGSEAALKAIDAAIERGDLFLAYDLARKACEAEPSKPIFRHRAVLALARMKSPRALPLYEEWELSKTHTGDRSLDVDLASLGARLLKDSALLAPAGQRQELLRIAAERYLVVYQQTSDYYPGTNAASLLLLSGDVKRAKAIAAEVGPRASGADFYSAASRAECALIVGDTGGAAAELNAIAGSGTPAQRTITRAQLLRTCGALGIDPEILKPLKPRCVVHFAGHMPGERLSMKYERGLRASIAALLDELDAGVGFGALAAGADILFAEALLARGAELNVVLPYPAEAFIETSVEGKGGAQWTERFRRCLAAAADVRVASQRREDGDDLQFGYGSMISAGLSILRAAHLGAPVIQAAVWDGMASTADHGTAGSVALWQMTGHKQHVIDPMGEPMDEAAFARLVYPAPAHDRAVRFVLFGDVSGFSQLSESQIIAFATKVMGALSEACHPMAGDILARNTWGDGIFLVFSRAAAAARAAAAMQEAMAAVDFAALGIPARLHLRLGLHCGPMSRVDDPMTGQVTYVGRQVNRAARIEPLTPPGTTYATEAFAACLALDPAAPFACDYVGDVTTGKSAGNIRVLSLVRRAG